ncbi:MAG: flagellar biosynthesis protein FlhA [Gammaproteobacteria bacterium]|nr:flagellar biosynthesis protein FlhA [Gammaproteobacteria bacterium]NNF60043.1 flagellar biosynthesis protein FlhA [Gammaproteobacteria bacterium]NNM19974.1 flagellar biosynthesis protein FlhA [Gammaproteobacteria bacterium]
MNAAVALNHAQTFARRGLGVPVLLILMLAMMVLPLPPFALDMLFSFNISLSLVIILAVIYVARPLEFGVFPTVLLLVTLLRLALNLASTRVVLLNGHSGTDAAGKVIEAFGEFVVGGNYTVGLVVFCILVIINFVVITKGAGRISEVSARFTLDAMPGKQMAIDADLNAGLISQDEARTRREEVRQEADFYGSMDGASKFVRGDATAGILILFINIIGGIVIGTLQHDMVFGDAVRTYTLLTIGDGLVAQIPSLLMSSSVAIIVTRMSGSQDMGDQVVQQVFGQPRTLGVSAGVLALLGFIPGMPNVAFLTLAGVCAGAGWLIFQREQQPQPVEKPPETEEQAPLPELSWDDVRPVDPIGLEVGYRLIPLVDRKQGGELMARIKAVRKKLSQDLGFLVQPVHIRDNLNLPPNAYRINLMGVPVAQHEVHPEKELAINPGRVFGEVAGAPTKEPAFGLDALWIEPAVREHAQTVGYRVVDPSTVVATHLNQILQMQAHELLGYEETQQLLDRLAQTAPKLVEDLVPKALPLGVVVRVLQDLLAERVPVSNIRKIAETLAENAAQTQDPATLVAAVRVGLGRSIVQSIVEADQELPVFTLDPGLERILHDSMQGSGDGPGLEPGLAERVQMALKSAAERQEIAGEAAVLLVAPNLRPWLARLARHSIRGLHVLAYNEVPDDKQLRLVAAVGQQENTEGTALAGA